MTVLTGTIMAVLDSSIVNVALPSMSGTLGVTVEEITWVVTGYILSQVIVMPITGMLSQRFGRKNFYLFSVALFTVASMLCGLASTLTLMVVFRVLQGFGGGVLTTVVAGDPAGDLPAGGAGDGDGALRDGGGGGAGDRAHAGRVADGQYSWPWVFYVNVPVGILNVLLVTRFIHDPPYLVRAEGAHRLGRARAADARPRARMQLMLEKGETKDWFQSPLHPAAGHRGGGGTDPLRLAGAAGPNARR